MSSVMFGSRLRRARLTAGYSSATKFAEVIGIAHNRYARWERGDAEPSIELLCRICDRLRITPDELLGYTRLSEPGFSDTQPTVQGRAAKAGLDAKAGKAVVAGVRPNGALDARLWKLAVQLAAMTPSTSRRSSRGTRGEEPRPGENLGHVATIFTGLRADLVGSLARLLVGAEFERADAKLRGRLQAEVRDLLSIVTGAR